MYNKSVQLLNKFLFHIPAKMLCPQCKHDNIKVLESRDTDNGIAVRRRRECDNRHPHPGETSVFPVGGIPFDVGCGFPWRFH